MLDSGRKSVLSPANLSNCPLLRRLVPRGTTKSQPPPRSFKAHRSTWNISLQTGPNPANHQNGTHPIAGAKRAPARVSFPPPALFSTPQPLTNTPRSNLFHPNELFPNSPNASQSLSTTSPRFPQRKHKRADHCRFTLNCHG